MTSQIIWFLLADLKELGLAGNNVTRLPAALAGATDLRRLSLTYNSELALTMADMDIILACMPLLEELLLATFKTPAAMIHYLRCSCSWITVLRWVMSFEHGLRVARTCRRLLVFIDLAGLLLLGCSNLF